jgi:hypothetical protein
VGLAMLGRSAKNNMQKYIIYLMAVGGFILVTKMTSSLEKRCIEAEAEADLYRPIINQYLWSQAAIKNPPALPKISTESDLHMNNEKPDYTLSVSTTKWLLYAGVLLITVSITWQVNITRLEKNIHKKSDQTNET